MRILCLRRDVITRPALRGSPPGVHIDRHPKAVLLSSLLCCVACMSGLAKLEVVTDYEARRTPQFRGVACAGRARSAIGCLRSLRQARVSTRSLPGHLQGWRKGDEGA